MALKTRFRTGQIRDRAIAAARHLAESGGYDAVQMRDVVRLTRLSSATIYRYFSSKDHLLAAVRLEWIRELGDVQASRLGELQGAERVVRLLHLACRAFAQSPKLGMATVLANGSTDPGVRACLREANTIVSDAIRAALDGEAVDPEEFVMLVGIAWEGALFAWVRGEMHIDEVEPRTWPRRRFVRASRRVTQRRDPGGRTRLRPDSGDQPRSL
jgi:AcrR family transcriptional regulator